MDLNRVTSENTKAASKAAAEMKEAIGQRTPTLDETIHKIIDAHHDGDSVVWHSNKRMHQLHRASLSTLLYALNKTLCSMPDGGKWFINGEEVKL